MSWWYNRASNPTDAVNRSTNRSVGSLKRPPQSFAGAPAEASESLPIAVPIGCTKAGDYTNLTRSTFDAAGCQCPRHPP